MLEKVRNILEEYIDVPKEQITMETNLLNDLDLTSLDVMGIIVAFEDEFGTQIPDQRIKELVTVGDIVEYLEKNVLN